MEEKKKRSEKILSFSFPLKPPFTSDRSQIRSIRELFSTGRKGDVGEDSISWRERESKSDGRNETWSRRGKSRARLRRID